MRIAVIGLRYRRELNKKRVPINNALQCAGMPMHFPCQECNADIMVPETYTPPPPKYCADCLPMFTTETS